MPTITVSAADVAMSNRIEAFILGWDGTDLNELLLDIEVAFPTATYRAFFVAWSRLLADRKMAVRCE